MSRVTMTQRLYLAAVGFLAVTVGIWSYFDPSQSAKGLPWTLPPLCATFLGSMYLSGAVYSVLCIFSKRWAEIELFMPQCALWTGGLAIVSLFYISAFDFSRNQTQLWWLAYIAYPLIALAWLWIQRGQRGVRSPDDSFLPRWMKSYLRAQGSGMIALGFALVLAPTFMQAVWAWQTGVMMLQMYSMPLMAYGVGCWLMTRGRTWWQIRNALIALAIFFSAEFFASVRFFKLLDGPAFVVAVWLGWLAVTTIVFVLLSGLAVRRTVFNTNSGRETTLRPQPKGA